MLPTTSTQPSAASGLPKRFMLIPDQGTLQVIYAAQCIGHVWSEQNRWWARTTEGTVLEIKGQSVLEAVTALFDEKNRHILLKAQ